MQDHPANPAPAYQWPKFVLAGVLLFLALAVWWLLREVNRIQRLKQHRIPASTNSAPSNLKTERPDGRAAACLTHRQPWRMPPAGATAVAPGPRDAS